METSASIKDIATALAAFQSKVGNVGKDSTNPFFKSKYASLENVVETIKAPLSECGLSYTQFPTGDNELCTMLMHSSGEWIRSTVKMSPKDNTPQGQGSAITYMRRYSLTAVLGLATEDDDDGNAASKPPVASKKAPASPQKDDNGFLNDDEVAEVQKAEIKKLMLDFYDGDVVVTPLAIRKATQIDAERKNYPEIIQKLNKMIEEKPPFE